MNRINIVSKTVSILSLTGALLLVLIGCASKGTRTTRTCYAHTGSGADMNTYSYKVPCAE